MKVIYILGGMGFIGSCFTKKCLELGWQCRVIDKLTYASNRHLVEKFNKYPNFLFENKDINDINHLYECDYIINFAAESDVTRSINNSDNFIKSNINGVHKILELIRAQLPNRKPTFIQISTDEVYSDIIQGSHKETDILKPSNPYSASKSAADLMVLAWYRTYQVPYLIIRMTNNYGLNQYPEKLIPRAIKHFNLKQKLHLHNNGTPVRSWLHVEDSTDAILLLINKGIQNEIYNVGSNLELTNIEVVNRIIENYLDTDQYKIDDYVDFNYDRPGQDVRYSLDDSKLRNLGWSPQKDFDVELKKIIFQSKNRFTW